MIRALRPLALILALGLPLAAPLPVFAVQPDEVLKDPLMEKRAREISKDLRCLVCRNESIDESTSDLARDLRLLVRERLVAGDSDGEVIDFIVERFGEYVLLRPLPGGANAILWAAGPVMFVIALGGALVYLRGRRERPKAPGQEALSTEEEDRLAKIMAEDKLS
ncbi:cytochrome c-type biogenesis protein [Falsigemmobacter faecalis]|uniref:Cytochrome c-type biogenesis protein n=1 Tax=Falsigemmobacter faecalis TaxID=2488730 RepID=A0A3P3DSW7_9RHOB|nr:cytochrome c-type biogenesis protein [Falsigemmobacter faecalis]RRH77360.1 cytochrome c-type biogenesis protein CcmH [Falsigemmobacter faecalis]